ncbi:MAG: DUF86 domain-containing protein [Methanomicrobiales archaeon]|nr:DUF86 domain-containing protein [Methanomicrobiales archaeon]
MRSVLIYLKDILDAMDKIQEFTAGMTLEEFSDDDKTISAVRDKFTIIGEAVKNIPEGVRKKYPAIAWKDMAGMRDILTHAYYRTDLKLLYSASMKRIPVERARIFGVYEEFKKN